MDMDMDDLIGQKLGNYRVIRSLGRGGFAKVYLGEHLKLGTQAAIKVLAARLTETAKADFLTEARTIANLDHPHIIRILDYDIEEDVPFLVMDYAPNGTLRQRYPKSTRMPPDIIRTYVQQAANAIQYAHDAKLIHRDIKPENMLLGKQNKLLLSDFGIVVIAHSSRSQPPEDVAGTLAYMAPEQIKGKPLRASDQYTLAVIVYEWLCGSHPFQGTPKEIAAQHLHAEPSSLLTHMPDLPSSIDLIIRQALDKNPDKRFGSVQEFAAAFDKASQDWLVSLTTVSIFQRSTHSNGLSQRSTQPNHTSQRFTLADRTFQRSTLAAPIPQTPAVSVQMPALNHVEHAPTSASQPAQPANKAQQRRLRRRFLLVTLDTLGIAAAIGAGTLALERLRPKSTPQKALSLHPTTLSQTLVTFTGHTSAVSTVAWSPDGKSIVSGSDDLTVQVWPANSGKSPLIHHGPSNINAVAWSPSHTEQRIASASGNPFFNLPGGYVVQILSPLSGALILTYTGHTQPVNTVTWSPDGTRIASGGNDNTVQVWDSSTGKRFFSFTKHTNQVTAVAWSPDGTRIASASFDKTVQIWDSQTGSPLAVLHHTNVVNAIAWSPDSTRIAAAIGNNVFGGDHIVQIWEVVTSAPILAYHEHTNDVTAVAWSPDGTYLASASSIIEKTVRVWNATTGKTVLTYSGHTLSVRAIAWSPDSTRIASASYDGTTRVWIAP